jgi:hypothetical protein
MGDNYFMQKLVRLSLTSLCKMNLLTESFVGSRFHHVVPGLIFRTFFYEVIENGLGIDEPRAVPGAHNRARELKAVEVFEVAMFLHEFVTEDPFHQVFQFLCVVDRNIIIY